MWLAASKTALRRSVASLAATAYALIAGLTLHGLAVWLRDQGPSWGSISLRGNGALIVLPLALAFLVAAELLCLRRRAWLGMLLTPVALVLGLFVLAGSF